MIRNTTALLLACAASMASASASATPNCSTPRSFYGTIERVNGNVITVRTPRGTWADVQIENGARVVANGNAMRPGTYLGAYGCVTPAGVFEASDVTLSSNGNPYSRTLTGTVTRVENGYIVVRENGYGYGSWYVPDSEDFHPGQQVSGTGWESRAGTFYPQTVNGQSVAYDGDNRDRDRSPRTITLTGVVQRVGANTLLVSETTNHTSGTWIVSNAGSRFRIGERVVGTGTEDRFGRFYPSHVTVQ